MIIVQSIYILLATIGWTHAAAQTNSIVSWSAAKHYLPSHRRSQGVQWVHLHPQGGEKNFLRRNLHWKCVSAPPGHEVHPQPEQESIFRTVFAGWVIFGDIFRLSLRATTKKGRQLFLAKKCTPDKILATPMYPQRKCNKMFCGRFLYHSMGRTSY